MPRVLRGHPRHIETFDVTGREVSPRSPPDPGDASADVNGLRHHSCEGRTAEAWDGEAWGCTQVCSELELPGPGALAQNTLTADGGRRYRK